MPKLPRNVYRRGEAYYLRVVVEGKRYRRSLGADLTEARRLAPLLILRIRRGPAGPEPPKVGTVQEFAGRWIAEHVAIRRNEKGQMLAAQRIRDHIAPVIGDLVLTEVRTPEIRRLRVALDAKGLSPQTVHHVLTDARCLFRYAVECEVIVRSPVTGVVFPRLQEQPPRRLSDIEVALILRETPDRYRLAVELALETGLRWGELHRLVWGDVLWGSGELRIHGTKSGAIRYVPLTGRARRLLEASRPLSARADLPVLAHRGTNPDSFVRIIRRRSGVRWTFHQLRHTFACRFLEAGGDREALRLMLGHSTLRMTHRYGAASREWLRAEVTRQDHEATREATTEGVAL